MKTKIYFSLFIMLLFVGCEKEKTADPTMTLNLKTIEFQHDDLKQLSVTPVQNCVWTSADTNVAKVSQTGLVTGVRLGSTIITAKSSTNNLLDECEVTVKPRSYLYLEPFFVYGQTKAYVKGKETRILEFENSTGLMYKGENSNVLNAMYLFKSNSMTTSDVMLNTGNYLAANIFLEERYEYIGYRDGFDIYLSKDGVFASLNIDDGLGLNVLYFKSSSKEITSIDIQNLSKLREQFKLVE